MAETNQMEWKPWIDFDTKEMEVLPIAEPPCVKCRHWRPERKYIDTPDGQIFDGVILCHSIMHRDFSCYSSRVLNS
jgi:hypothetical protein